MPKHLDVQPTAFACSVCCDENDAAGDDDPQTYKAFLTWMKKHRTNYVTSAMGLCICANRHTCTQGEYNSLREQAIRKRGLGTYVIACPVAGCAEALYETPRLQPLWDRLVTVCGNGHLVDFNCYQRLLSRNITTCPPCRATLQLVATETIPTVAMSFPGQMCDVYRPLDGLNNLLDLLLFEDEDSGANLIHGDFRSMVQHIFFDAIYPVPFQRDIGYQNSDRGMVSRFLLMATSENNLALHKFALASFQKHWDEFVKVLDREAPCTLVACLNFIQRFRDTITETMTQGETAHNDPVRTAILAEMRVVFGYLRTAFLFVEKTWWLIENAQTGLVVGNIPSEPQLPDVASPQESVEDRLPQYLR